MYTDRDKNQARGEMLAYPSGNMVTSILPPLIYERSPQFMGGNATTVLTPEAPSGPTQPLTDTIPHTLASEPERQTPGRVDWCR